MDRLLAQLVQQVADDAGEERVRADNLLRGASERCLEGAHVVCAEALGQIDNAPVEGVMGELQWW